MQNQKKIDLFVPQSVVVNIGDIPLGGNFPIRIQSMTNTNTLDTVSTVSQCISLIDEGCDFVRISTPSIKEAENLSVIKRKLKEKGYDTPLIADIHFRPSVAETAARIVEKIRINPGNYTDKTLKITEIISETEYASHLEIMRKKVSSLISICKEYGTAIRIGVNHGSLSERIVKRYGNTAEGMTASALEFINVCESLNFKNIVISMKSSNVLTMVQSTRMLMKRMIEAGCIYPLHLGVTEAGDSEEGISKSALGCGALLSDGIGDTIRVSLTGNPIIEIPVAKTISDFFNHTRILKPESINNSQNYSYLNKNIINSISSKIKDIAGTIYPVVFNYDKNIYDESEILKNSGLKFNNVDNIWKKSDITPDIININNIIFKKHLKSEVNIIKNKIIDINNIRYINLDFNIKNNCNINIKKININEPILRTENFIYNNKRNEAVFAEVDELADVKDFQIKASLTLGKLLLDDFIDGIIINILHTGNKVELTKTIFHLLQASRKRINNTEYISCPTCGRTTYDVAGTLKKIKNKVKNIKNLKIAVMGCVVNGPGEMADADYGYVGTTKGKVNIYKKGKIIYKNIPENEAINKLSELILVSETD